MKRAAVQPITTLKRDAAELIEQAAAQRAPILITQHGKASAVLVDVETYEEEQRAFELLKLALQGEQDITDGRHVSLADHRARMRALLRERR